MFARRTDHDATPNALTRAVHELRAAGRDILDLTVGNPTVANIPCDEDAIRSALCDARILRYEPVPLGLPGARAAVAEYLARHGVRAAAGRIVLTASTSEAYAYLFKLLCEVGDEVLVPAPSYPLLAYLAGLEGVELRPYELERSGGRWTIEGTALARSERTRAIVVVSPNNPTGSYLTRGELATLARTGLPVICDEVFARYPLQAPADRVTSALELEGSLVFSLGGLSKEAALPQMKLAWTAVGGPDAVAAEALSRLELIADTFLSVSTPVQVALPELLASADVAGDAIRARIAANLGHLRSLITPGSPISIPVVEGGWYACLRVPRIHADEAWAELLVREDGVLIQPGYFFDFPDSEAWLIVSLLTPTASFVAGTTRLVARVAAACG